MKQEIKRFLFQKFGRRLCQFISSPHLLDLPRMTPEDIALSVRKARADNLGMPVYVFTDMRLKPIVGAVPVVLRDLELLKKPYALVIACNSDEMSLQAVEFCGRHDIPYYGANRLYPAARFFNRNEFARLALQECYHSNPDKFDLLDFENITQAIHATRDIAGDYVEIGVYKGGSAAVALAYLEKSGIKRTCYFLDTFSGFDYADAEASKDRAWKDSHKDTSLAGVRNRLSRFPVQHHVIQSNIITNAIPDEIQQIAVCNIDVDMREAVSAALMKVAPLMVVGGIIIAEDQGHTPYLIGAYAAMRDFLSSSIGKSFVPIEMISGQMFLIRKQSP